MAADLDPLINTQTPPSGEGCRDCLATTTGWWFHLRRCATCGVIGCCDSSPAQHATRHARESGHAIVRSFEPGEDWFYDYRTSAPVAGAELAPPASRPADQPAPGPADRLPQDWRRQLH